MKAFLVGLLVLGAVSSFANTEENEAALGKSCSVSSTVLQCGSERIVAKGCSVSCGILPLHTIASCESGYMIECSSQKIHYRHGVCECIEG